MLKNFYTYVLIALIYAGASALLSSAGGFCLLKDKDLHIQSQQKLLHGTTSTETTMSTNQDTTNHIGVLEINPKEPKTQAIIGIEGDGIYHLNTHDGQKGAGIYY